MQIEPQKLDQNLLEKSHGSLFTEENREKGTSMKGLPRDQLTKKRRKDGEIDGTGPIRQLFVKSDPRNVSNPRIIKNRDMSS